MNHLYLLIAFAFLASSCAKPNWAEENQNINNSSASGQNDPKCPLEFKKLSTCAKLEFANLIRTGTFTKFKLQLSKELPKTGALNIYLWMPDMGHGSSPVTITKLSPTLYEVSQASFIMRGKWEIHIEVIVQEQIVDKVIYSLNI